MVSARGKKLSHSHPPVLGLGPLRILLPGPSNKLNPRGTEQLKEGTTDIQLELVHHV